MKNIYYNDFPKEFIVKAHDSMMQEIDGLGFRHPIRMLFNDAWCDFSLNKFGYDGATFVRERYNDSIWEIASFIHDWRNSKGYVGKKIDNEFIDIMKTLDYPKRIIKERCFLMRAFTWINILRHFFKGTLKKRTPSNLFTIKY